MSEHDDRIVLFEGRDEENDEGDEVYLPSLWLEHDAARHELYVGVGETVAGMVESVDAEVFEAVKVRVLTAPERVVMLAAVLGDNLQPEALNSAVGKLEKSLGNPHE